MKFIQYICDRGANAKEIEVDINWHPLSLHSDWNYELLKYAPSKPSNLKEMLEIVNTFCQDFIYVRVDLYNIAGKIYFEELNFHPATGVYSSTDEFEFGEYFD